MKVGIIRGPFFNKWEMQTFEFVPELGINVVGIVPKEHFYNIQGIKFPIIETHQLSYLNKIPYLKLYIQKKLNLDYFLKGFNKIVKDMDLLHTAETYHIFTYQAIKSGKPTIVTIWENIPFNYHKKPFLKIIKSTFQNAKHFIAITNRAKESLIIEGVSEDKISVIPCGVNIQTFAPKTKNTKLLKLLNIPENSKIILFIGRLVWEKGIYSLIYAFYKLLKSHKNLILIIVGNGTERTNINNLVLKLGIHKNIRFLRNVAYEKTPDLYNIADIMVVPSIPTHFWTEQFGFIFIEAMACGTPVISTWSGSIPEVVKHEYSGILVPPMNFMKLADAINRLLNEDLNIWSKNAREYAINNFNSKKIAEKIVETYKKIV